MELIVTSFLATALAFVGHLGLVIANQLRRPTRPVWVVTERPHEPPPAKRSTVPCALYARKALPA